VTVPFFVVVIGSSTVLAQPDLALQAKEGKAAMAAGRFADAAAIYEKVVRALPDDAGMRLNLGMALSMAGRPRAATPHLERAVDLKPALTPAWLFLGLCRLESGDAAAASSALRKVLSAEPGNVRARELLAEALLILQQYENAANEFHLVTEQRPSGARGWYGLGRSYQALGRNDAAGEAFRRLESLPASPELHQFRAEIARERGRSVEAVEELQKALHFVPDDLGLQKALARALYEAKDYERALAVLERAIARDRSPDMLHVLGDTLLVTGRSAEAVKVLQEAVSLQPKSVQARASLGRAYAQAGNPTAAIPHLEAAVTAGVDEDGALHYQLARAYQAVGKPELAKKMLEKYAALSRR
jgi:tetratricopeptide (TPR) repeat protein